MPSQPRTILSRGHFSRILCLILMLLAAGQAYAQLALTMSGGGATASTVSSVRDSSGNLYVSGYFSGGNIDIGAVSVPTIGINDAFVAKLDSNGQTLWAKSFGGSGARTNAAPYALAVDSAGNVYVGGACNGADMTSPALSKIGETDVYALKLDPAGNVLWAKRYGGSGTYASASGLALDAANNVYFTGYFGYGNIDTPALTRLGSRDTFLIKLDSDGNPQWATSVGGSGSETGALSLAVDSAGNSYMSGYFSANLSSPALSKTGNNDAFAIKVASDGSVAWAKAFGGAGATAMAYGIAVDGSGNSYLAGLFQSADLTTPALSRIGSRDAFLFKLAADGSISWAKNFGGSAVITDGRGVAVDSAGKIHFTGHFSNGNLTTPAITALGYQDGFALKLTAAGDIVWQQQYGGWHAYVTNNHATSDNQGRVYFAGKFSAAALTMPAMSGVLGDNGMLIRQIAAYVPGKATAVSATAGVNEITVSFTPPADSGATAITAYHVSASPAEGVDALSGSTATSRTFRGLRAGVDYTFSVTATNSEGTGEASLPSTAVSPLAPPPEPIPEPTETIVMPGGTATLGQLPVVSHGGGTLTIPAGSQGGSISLQANASSGTSSSTVLLIGEQRISVQPVNGPATLSLLRSPLQDPPVLVLQAGSGQLNISASPGQPFLLIAGGLLSATSADLQARLGNGRLAVNAGSAMLMMPGNQLAADSGLAIHAGEVLESDGPGHARLRVGSFSGKDQQAGDLLPAAGGDLPPAVQLNGALGRLNGQSPLAIVAATVAHGPLSQGSDGSLRPALHALPLALRIDSQVSDGVAYADGLLEVARNGLVIQLVPLLVDAPALLAEVDRITGKSGSSLSLQANGVYNIVSPPRQFVLRAALAAPGASSTALAGDGRGNWRWASQGLLQTLYPSFRYADQLAATLTGIDPQASLANNNDGSYRASLYGQAYRLRPTLEILNLFSLPAAHINDPWWLSDGQLFIRYDNRTAQGFTID